MRIVVALGGNALLKRGEAQDAATLARNAAAAARSLAPLLAAGHALVITHGNGPQIGLLALQAAASGAPPFPLDVLGAESEGLVGYLLERELANALPGRHFATLLTQVLVDPEDPAFANPTKPIGAVYERAAADDLGRRHGWRFARDGGGWRRVVASPAPQRILEASTIRLLVDAGVTPICVGGGGIPVQRAADGRLVGCEAVIDKDHASAMLARELGADALLLLTDVAGVWTAWPPEAGRRIRRATPAALAALSFAAGSMGPKVAAACAFAETGGVAAIGALDDAAAVLAGTAGTRIERGDASLALWPDG